MYVYFCTNADLDSEKPINIARDNDPFSRATESTLATASRPARPICIAAGQSTYL